MRSISCTLAFKGDNYKMYININFSISVKSNIASKKNINTQILHVSYLTEGEQISYINNPYVYPYIWLDS